MRRFRVFPVAALVVMSTLMCAQRAFAQLTNFNWNLSPPGARAGSMGGAFIAVADDATASVTNPAGLTALTKPQVYVELKSTDFQGRVSDVKPTRINSAPFFSVSTPIGNRASVAFTRHEFLNDQESFSDPTNPFHDFAFSVNSRGVSYAGSVAVRIDSHFQVGATVSANRLDNRGSRGVSFVYAETETQLGFVAGGMWRPSEQLSIGVAASKGNRYGQVSSVTYVEVPARAGLGVAVRPSGRFMATGDVVWVGATQNIALVAGLPANSSVFETRGGAEYLLVTGNVPLYVRGGAYAITAGNAQESGFNLRSNDATLGFGLTRGQHFQVDVAYSAGSRELVLSTAARF